VKDFLFLLKSTLFSILLEKSNLFDEFKFVYVISLEQGNWKLGFRPWQIHSLALSFLTSQFLPYFHTYL
jgi:hypothetical protein